LRAAPSRATAAAVACSLLFVLAGLAFYPLAGLEDDEAMFASALYDQTTIVHSVKLFGHRIPVMLMSYLGALKSWIYAPVFWIWKPAAGSIRIPVLLLGALTILLFYRLMLRIAGERAAVVGCVLLSADTTWLLTTCFDWGPVVLQHLLLVSGALSLVRFHQQNQRRFLAAGFLLFGLGLWDKAIFIWILSGMAVAAALVYPREVWKDFGWRNAAIAILAFGLGAAPLIRYNVRQPFATIGSNASFDRGTLASKIQNVFSTLSGQALFGFLARADPDGKDAGHLHDGYFGYALLAAVLLLPLLRKTPALRPIVFALTAMIVAWTQMLFTRGAGTSPHHVILLWPFPTLIVAVAFAQLSRMGRMGKPLLAAAVLFLAGTSALVTHEYFACLVRNGPGVGWTDAIDPLCRSLEYAHAESIYINDWGMSYALGALSSGKLPVRVVNNLPTKQDIDGEDGRVVLARIAESGAVFVSHADGAEEFKGVNARLLGLAVAGGYRREPIAEIADRHGRNIFEVFRFVRQ
jgi:4-amino-4-deoxy-L-arabinose transferase-like glycosyltransferase